MGRFIVIEGLDGAGTTTQTARLAAHLEARGQGVTPTREPTDGPVGRLLRAVLRSDAPDLPDASTLPWLFAADRADHLARTVRPALAAGRWVVSDRYLPSSLAYQSLDVPLDLVAALNQAFPVPDLLVFVRVPSHVGLARVAARGAPADRFEEAGALSRIAAAYEAVLLRLRSEGWPIAEVDGAASVEAVTAAIVAAIDAHGLWEPAS